MQEVWRNIKDYEDYQASSEGRIKSLKRGKERILKRSYNSYGYPHVILYKNGYKKTMRVHRIIAMTFIENYDNLPQVNHKNGDKTDNRVCNLEWVSASENIKHAFENGFKDLQYSTCKEMGIKYGGRNAKPVNQYNLQGDFIKTWNSMHEADRQLNIRNQDIAKCCKGKRKTAGGYKWKYKDTQ